MPDYGPYAGKDWPRQEKGQAAMITRLDSCGGRMLDHLALRSLAKNTLVIFTSDNGPHDESGHDLSRFDPAGPYTGIKRSLTDGGIRVPCIAWWPGRVKVGTESPHVAYFGDWFATAVDLAGASLPEGRDSLRFAPTLLGRADTQRRHDLLYCEFHEGGFTQAALYQWRWKGIRAGGPGASIALYDQQNDAAEKDDVAAKHTEITAKISAYLQSARMTLPEWEPKWQAESPKK